MVAEEGHENQVGFKYCKQDLHIWHDSFPLMYLSVRSWECCRDEKFQPMSVWYSCHQVWRVNESRMSCWLHLHIRNLIFLLLGYKNVAIIINYVNPIPVFLISLNFQLKSILNIMKYDSMLFKKFLAHNLMGFMLKQLVHTSVPTKV